MNRKLGASLMLAAMLVGLMPMVDAGPRGPADWAETQLHNGDWPPATSFADNVGYACQVPGGAADLVTVNKTTDSGQTWSTVFTGDTGTAFSDSRCDVTAITGNHAVLSFVPLNDNTQVNVTVTTDGGDTWTDQGLALDFGAAIPTGTVIVHTPGDDDVVVIAYSNTQIRAARSLDGGTTWDSDTQLDTFTSLNQGQELRGSVVSYDSSTVRLIYGADSNEFTVVSTNNGGTWSAANDVNLTGSNPRSKLQWTAINETRWLASSLTDNAPQSFLLEETTDSGATWTEIENLTASASGQDVPVVASDSDSWMWANHADPGDASCPAGNTNPCLMVNWTEDAGATWTRVRLTTADRAESAESTVLMASGGPDHYTVSTWNGTSDFATWVYSTGDASIPGLDTLEPTATKSNLGILRDVRTDWTDDNAGHEVYVRQVGLSNIIARALVFNPSLDTLRAFSPCNLAGGTVENTLPRDFETTKEATERVVWPCNTEDGHPAYVLANGTTGQFINLVDLDGLVGAPFSQKWVSCTNANQCITSNREDTHVIQFDPLNGRALWARSFAGTQHVAAEKNQTARWAVTGDSGTRLYGVSGAVQTTRGDLNFDAVAIWGEKVWIGDGPGTRQYNVSGNTLNFCCGNVSLPVEEGGLRISKDGQWLMTWNNDRAHVVEPDTLRAVVRVDPAGDIVAADMDFNNSQLYVANQTALFAYDLTGTNVTRSTLTAPTGANGTETTNLTGPSVSDDNTFTTLMEQFVGGIFGLDGEDSQFAAAAFLIVALGLACAGVLSKLGGNAGIGVACGIAGGVLLSHSFNWIPDWVVVVIGLVAGAVIVVRM